MRLLPEANDRDWIVTHLAEILRLRGAKRFMTAPIVEPTAAFFPDEWHGDEASVRRLLRRILAYAGLGELSFELELYGAIHEDVPHGDLHVEGVHHVGEAPRLSHQGRVVP